MAATPSAMRELGTPMPAFSLTDVMTGRSFSSSVLEDAPASVVAFICYHCPFVKHIRPKLAELGRYLDERGVGMVAINSNDVAAYPQDGPDGMIEEARSAGYTFPYLYDETQEVAKAFDAACTPDFFVFDGDGRLAYRGQFDGSRPGNRLPVTGCDLRAAVDTLLRGDRPSGNQKPSIGCNIKWKPGNAPADSGL